MDSLRHLIDYWRHGAATALGAAACLVAFSCAGQIQPSGGPPDKTPPEITAVLPAPGTTLFGGGTVHLQFSKYVDRRSLEESVFFSPPVGTLEFDWGGTDVGIRFRDTLRANTTYIMTVGTDVKDTPDRGGNRMASAFALPFSTGDHIDSAMISGAVFDPVPDGIMIFAYDLRTHRSDTLNPGTVKPDFLTETGKDGSFRLPYLPYGSYRLIAVGDQYKNLLYDRQVDRYGVSTGDIRLSVDTSRVRDILFRMATEDTTSPFLSSVKAVDRRHLLARFSEAIDTVGVDLNAFSINDTLTGAALAVVNVSFVDSLRLDAQIVTGDQDSAAVYRLRVRNMRDRSGNAIAAGAASAVTTGSVHPDTSLPTMTSPFPEDSSRGVPRDVPLRFSWKKAILAPSFGHAFALIDSAGTPVAGTLRWEGAMAATFVPALPLEFNARYTLRVVMDSVADFSGNRYRDSTLVRHFRTEDDRHFSSIAGRVEDTPGRKRGRLHVLANDVNAGEVHRYEAVLDSAGPFAFPHVEEGRYAFQVYRDMDGNGVFSNGSPYPFSVAEPFTVHADTIKVRARWPVEGLVLRLVERP